MFSRRLPALLASTLLATAVPASALTPPSEPENFPDVPSGHRYAEAIAAVRDRAFVNGYPDGTYRPDVSINRAEFTKIIVLARYTESEIDDWLAGADVVGFPDVAWNAWFARYVHFAQGQGIVRGNPDGTFRPSANVNLAEAAKIAGPTLAGSFMGMTYCESTGECPWWQPYVGGLENLHALPPTATKTDNPLTRGEMAFMIWKLTEEPDDAPVSGGGECRVAGCSGQLCLEDGEDGISTCEWTPAYACYADAMCERQADGKCGWTQTAQLTACLEDANAEMP